ncbi:MAG: SDR family NAD(P)-dependent oxidoreductase, partial [Rhizobium sp.]
MSNETKTAIVTGASRGIGAAIARRLATDGFHTVVNYAANAAQAEEVVSAIAAASGRALALRADVSDPQAVADLFERTEAEFGTVDVLVNNAGVTTFGPLSDVSDEDYHRLIAVNLTGTFNGMREGARRVREG